MKRNEEYCMDCDGCGWTEGGKTLQTTCTRCKGKGVVKRATVMEIQSRTCEACARVIGDDEKFIIDEHNGFYLCPECAHEELVGQSQLLSEVRDAMEWFAENYCTDGGLDFSEITEQTEPLQTVYTRDKGEHAADFLIRAYRNRQVRA